MLTCSFCIFMEIAMELVGGKKWYVFSLSMVGVRRLSTG
jgi:hypothetical protein